MKFRPYSPVHISAPFGPMTQTIEAANEQKTALEPSIQSCVTRQ